MVKDTARRLTENKGMRVPASQMDRDLSIDYDFVSIEGDTAVYKNVWSAAGIEITWNMIHYDVQLIGGMVLHKVKLLRWLLVKEKHWYQLYLHTSMH